MSEKCMCPRCGQPLPPQSREGVWLPAMKAQIFDFIDQHQGVTAEGIAYHVGNKPDNIRQHVNQINTMLESTDVKIRCDRDGNRPGSYRIRRGPCRPKTRTSR
jgi:hypothetical protein